MKPPNSKDLVIRSHPQYAAGTGGTRARKGRKNTNKTPELQFINSTTSPNEAKSDLAVRRLIRAQARRSGALKQGALSTGTDVDNVNYETNKQFDKKLHTSRFKLSTWSRKPHSRKKVDEDVHEDTDSPQNEQELAFIVRYLEEISTVPRLLDPLNPLPIPFLPQTRRMLQFCKLETSILELSANIVRRKRFLDQFLRP
jgi:hypothetical protein